MAYPDTQTCLLSTGDGDYSVFVLVKDTAGCGEWTQALAGDGSFWSFVGTGGPVGTGYAHWPPMA